MSDILTLADIKVEDDLSVHSDPDTYKDKQFKFFPPEAGNYQVRVDKHKVKTNAAGEVIYIDDKFPIIQLTTLEIVAPDHMAGRKFAPFQDVTTNSRDRDGYPTSDLGDLLRSYDQTTGFVGLEAGLTLLRGFIDQGATFRVRTDWEARDMKWIMETIKAEGIPERKHRTPEQQKRNNEIWKQGTLRGMNKFPKQKNGRPDSEWTGPSGEPCEARSIIIHYYPSMEEVKL